MSTAPAARRFTVDEYIRMSDAGVFGPEERTELVRGEIVQMTPINPPHAGCVTALTSIFGRRDGAQVRTQLPLDVSADSMPEPDLVVVKRRDDCYKSRHPRPDDVLLLIEVSHLTLRFDLEVRVPLYAEFKVPETWVVDLENRCVRVFRDPAPDGYHTMLTFTPGQTLTAVRLPDLELPVDRVLLAPYGHVSSSSRTSASSFFSSASSRVSSCWPCSRLAQKPSRRTPSRTGSIRAV